MEENKAKEKLLFVLREHGLNVVSHEGKMVQLEKFYTIEVEGKELFKLLHGGQVVAPFADLNELCQFIKMDMELNEES